MSNPLCVLACRWTISPSFWQWCGVNDPAGAKRFIVRTCAVKSRKDLDVSAVAAEVFHREIRLPFMQFLQSLTQAGDVEARVPVALKLLQHGTLSGAEFRNITGWQHAVSEAVLAHLLATERVVYLGAEFDLYRLR